MRMQCSSNVRSFTVTTNKRKLSSLHEITPKSFIPLIASHAKLPRQLIVFAFLFKNSGQEFTFYIFEDSLADASKIRHKKKTDLKSFQPSSTAKSPLKSPRQQSGEEEHAMLPSIHVAMMEKSPRQQSGEEEHAMLPSIHVAMMEVDKGSDRSSDQNNNQVVIEVVIEIKIEVVIGAVIEVEVEITVDVFVQTFGNGKKTFGLQKMILVYLFLKSILSRLQITVFDLFPS
ncbi:hypothetical protein Glove_13g177 [Diversispora epigaea]|uniref:Uncharacterized protein n=1 Tax=Diversispora epigaea TaxID=1348612 RepID=A0A397JWH5_9GLOM|nr:hypothetical protein Glove_13g177 [Diversispora epigaea]